MRNLFVLHTQYNLILGTGLAHTVFAKDTNHLILFSKPKVKTTAFRR